jgi:hypothetical protein
MQVGAFCGEFSEKGLAICGLLKRISRKTTLFMPMLVVRIVDLSWHPLFWLQGSEIYGLKSKFEVVGFKI